MSHAEHADHPAVEQHGLTVRQYLMIGAMLTVITILELAVSYSGMGDPMIPILIALSAVKFATVVGYFMHLRFDSPLFARAFVGSLLLAIAILTVFVTLFWTGNSIPVG